MKQKRTSQDEPNRSSNMEQAEGSRETATDSGSMRSGERMRNSESSAQDLGSSSDRAMFTDRDSAEERSGSSERGTGSSGERNRGDSGESSSDTSSSGNSGGITNRELDREEWEQQQLPDRGRSQSER